MNPYLHMITYSTYFGEIVMCQSQCRIEMSTFAAEWSTIAKSAVSNILYQSKHFPVKYHNICVKLKIGLEFERTNFKNSFSSRETFSLSDIFGSRSGGILALSSGNCPLPGVIFTSLYLD